MTKLLSDYLLGDILLPGIYYLMFAYDKTVNRWRREIL